MSIQTAKDALIQRINTVSETSTSLEDLSYASAALAKLSEAQPTITDPDIYTIGTPGTFGFGVGALQTDDIPTGWTPLSGHDDPNSANYGNYLDPLGSHMVFIPKFWYKWSGNTVLISKIPASGYVLPEAFRFCSKGFFHGKTHFGNVEGKAITKIGIAPCSTATDNNPIGNLTGTPPNTYAGVITAVKLLSADHHAESVFEAYALAIIAKAHSSASQNTAVCAFKDVLPHLPKGNNNNALKDANDRGVEFVTAGNATYPACALTGSGFPFAKTTHNGQSCGVADVNGSMWRVNIGLTKANETDGIFQILKTTVNPNDITAANLHDAANYDNIDLTDLMPSGAQGSILFGNSAEQVFSTSVDTNSLDFRRANAGIPLSTGVSSGGTNDFGNDQFYRYWRTNMMPLVGGYWGYASGAGVFGRAVAYPSSDSSYVAGGAACVSL